MKPHCWIEWRKPIKLVVFAIAVLAIAVYWSFVVRGITPGPRIRYGGPGHFVILMFVGWVGGWFLALFVRAEDLSMTVSYPYQSTCRAIGAMMILAGAASGAFLAIAF